jgi:hypothetical protein
MTTPPMMWPPASRTGTALTLTIRRDASGRTISITSSLTISPDVSTRASGHSWFAYCRSLSGPGPGRKPAYIAS